jgi:hypothetical protein
MIGCRVAFPMPLSGIQRPWGVYRGGLVLGKLYTAFERTSMGGEEGRRTQKAKGRERAGPAFNAGRIPTVATPTDSVDGLNGSR